MEDLKFEEALKKLEKIINEMEEGNLALEESLKKFKEGMHLFKVCTEKLEKAECEIKKLTEEEMQ